MSSRLHELEGIEYEQVYMAEVMKFRGAVKGVHHEDIVAAIILRDEGPTNPMAVELLGKLHERKIRAIYADEESTFYDLEFETQ